MSKKTNKKLRDLARLQSLYGTTQAPTSESMQGNQVENHTPAPKAYDFHIKHNADHAVVARDLRDLVGLIILMTVLLFALYWLVGNTAFADWLLSIGKNVA